MKKPKPFATEVDLCAAFIAAMPKGWTSYAETAGWDILLSRDADGFQVGVQAKLQFNAHVLCQALEHGEWYRATNPGPDCRAVLVPAGENKLGEIADFLGITVVAYAGPHFFPRLPQGRDTHFWHEWAPAKRHPLPDYVPDVAAGDKAPIQLTDWKIKALRLMAIMERRGHVTREDFKALQLDHRRWLQKVGWLSPSDSGWVANQYTPDLRGQHPKVYAEIVASADKWMPPHLRSTTPPDARETGL